MILAHSTPPRVPDSLSRRLTDHEGAESALVRASGREAAARTVLALRRPDDCLLGLEPIVTSIVALTAALTVALTSALTTPSLTAR